MVSSFLSLVSLKFSFAFSFFFSNLINLITDEKLPTMDWETRYKIAVGTAKGLYYLHKLCPRRIIHRDIKASNILLSEEYEPQVFILIFEISSVFYECCALCISCCTKKSLCSFIN